MTVSLGFPEWLARLRLQEVTAGTVELPLQFWQLVRIRLKKPPRTVVQVVRAAQVVLLDPEFDGAGFGSLRLQINKDEGFEDFQTFSYEFTTLNEALSFFDDNVLWLDRLHPEEDLHLSFLADYAGTGGDDAFRFNILFGTAVPAPPAVWLLGTALVAMLSRVRRPR